jgi:hypothetical protein
MDTPTPPTEQTPGQTTTVTTEVKTRKVGEAELETINTVIRKASPLSVGIALCLAILGVIGWFHRDVISKALDSSSELAKVRMQMDFNQQKATLEMAALKTHHDHCQETLKSVNDSIKQLQSEVASLKAKSVASQ